MGFMGDPLPTDSCVWVTSVDANSLFPILNCCIMRLLFISFCMFVCVVLHSKPVSFSTGNEQSKSIAFTDVPVGNYSLSIGYEKKNELSKWIALPDDQPVSMVVSPLIRIIQKQFNDLVKVCECSL